MSAVSAHGHANIRLSNILLLTQLPTPSTNTAILTGPSVAAQLLSMAHPAVECESRRSGRQGVDPQSVTVPQELTKTVTAGARIVLCCSGRGDKVCRSETGFGDAEPGSLHIMHAVLEVCLQV